MEKKQIRVFFADFWKGFNVNDNFFINRLRVYYNVILDDKNPDYLFYSWYGSANQRYFKSIRIYFTGENDVPDFNLCDYAAGFHFITFNDRYLRLPLYVLYSCFPKSTEPLTLSSECDKSNFLNRGFCSFVVSNSKVADPIRDHFFKALSAYKAVHSGGKHLNNIGYFVPDKSEFISQYKFNLAFENSSLPGYTTEKLVEAFAEKTIPIYWGNPAVAVDFNPKAFVNISDFESIEHAVAEVKRLDSDENAYMAMLSEPAYANHQLKPDDLIEFFDQFVCAIINQPLEQASRLSKYGHARIYRNRNFILNYIASLPVFKHFIRKAIYNLKKLK